MSEPDVRQVVVHPAIWPHLELWLANRGLVLGRIPVEPNDLPTFIVATADPGQAEKVLAKAVQEAIRKKVQDAPRHPCCTFHREACCDPEDCGPCCEDCPTCPTLIAHRTVTCDHCRGTGADPDSEGEWVPEAGAHMPASPCLECSGKGATYRPPAGRTELWSLIDWSLWGSGMGDVLREALADQFIAAITPEQHMQALRLIKAWTDSGHEPLGRRRYEDQQRHLRRARDAAAYWYSQMSDRPASFCGWSEDEATTSCDWDPACPDHGRPASPKDQPMKAQAPSGESTR